MTGHNGELAQRLRTSCGDNTEIYGFREDVPQLMAGADIIITKAGGLTSAEVLASDLDLVIYKPLPGQEEGNAAFLQQHCGAFVAHSLDALVRYIQTSHQNVQQSSLRTQHAHPLAAQQIAEYILQKIKK